MIGFLFVAVAFFGALGIYLEDLKTDFLPNDSNRVESNNISQKKDLVINQVWRSDFKKLIKKGLVPKAWTKISQVVFLPTDVLTKELMLYLQAPVKINKNGPYRLEVSIMSHKSEKNEAQLLLQHNIIDTENENTLWEMNRTYPLYSK